MKIGLTARIVVIFMALAAALLGIVGVLSYRSASQSLKTAVMSKMLGVAIEKQSVLDGWFEQQRDNLSRAATDTTLIGEVVPLLSRSPDKLSGAASPALAAKLKALGSGFVELFVIDARTGRVLASTDPALTDRMEAGKPYFEQSKTSIYMPPPHYSVELRAPVMLAGAPIRDENGKLIAVLAARLDYDALNEVMRRRTGLNRTEDAYLVNPEGIVVTRPHFMDAQSALRRQIDTAAVRHVIAGDSGTIIAADYRGKQAISVYLWITKYQLGLILEIDQAEALAPALALRRTVIWISLLSLIVTAGLALLLAHTITRPLRELRWAMVHFAGKGEEALLPDDNGDELALLARAFREMEKRVVQRAGELANSVSLLGATLDSTGDGILAIRLTGEILSYNSQWATMWSFPEDVHVLESEGLSALMRVQLVNPEPLEALIAQLRVHPAQAFYLLELRDSRFIELHVNPQRSDGEIVGLVLNCRDITERRRAEAEIEAIHEQLVNASRAAGKAEVATNVLHNVGNVLNSVNVSATLVADRVGKSKISGLAKAVAMLREHEADLGDFLCHHPQGKILPGYLMQLSEHLERDREATLKELAFLVQNIEHIKEIVAMQQTHAGASNAEKVVRIPDLIDEALRVYETGGRSGLEIVRDIEDVPPIRLDKHKTLQILVNLIGNARQACESAKHEDKRMTVRVATHDGRLNVAVSDNGVGIAKENLTRIFRHGFTTKPNGHGFGLHSAALNAKEMGGALHAHSEGIGQGATFTLELPLQLSGELS